MTRRNPHGISQALQRLFDYPAGTLIEIAGRKFYRLALGSFWREDIGDVEHHPSRTCLFIRNVEIIYNERHKVIRRL
jgi:hypothetical protein